MNLQELKEHIRIHHYAGISDIHITNKGSIVFDLFFISVEVIPTGPGKFDLVVHKQERKTVTEVTSSEKIVV